MQEAAASFDPIAEARRHWRDHGWADVELGMGVVTSIMRVQQVLLARADSVLAPYGLTFPRYEVLMLLLFSRRGSLPVGKIGERLQVHPTTATSAVDRLVAQGLVTRERNPRDGRSVLVGITPEGRRVARRATPAMNSAIFAALGLDPAQQSTLYRLLEELR